LEPQKHLCSGPVRMGVANTTQRRPQELSGITHAKKGKGPFDFFNLHPEKTHRETGDRGERSRQATG